MTEPPPPALQTLGEDLILLTPPSLSGAINVPLRLPYGLMGSELIRLVAAGYVEIVKGRIKTFAIMPPADPNLQEAFNSLHGSPKAKRWVGKPRKQIKVTYLGQLEARNILRSESGKSLKLFPWKHWYPVDRQRHTVLRERLDRIIAAPDPLAIEDRSFAGLAYAIGLSELLYEGKERSEQRERLKQIAHPKKPGRFSRHRDEAPEPMGAATSASIDAAQDAAIDTAVQAAIDQAISSAVDSAIAAAVDGGGGHGGHDGGGGGGHGGGHG
jgi:hypothetical protein